MPVVASVSAPLISLADQPIAVSAHPVVPAGSALCLATLLLYNTHAQQEG
ncbi:MAG TPA: hypothetical protein VFV38_05480 [Ktedonobacteraceae bacterium]|nr:hypothetical protein [Ktedonobacteraceae bacterium]